MNFNFVWHDSETIDEFDVLLSIEEKSILNLFRGNNLLINIIQDYSVYKTVLFL